jgi:hypothetical protein
MVGCPFDSGSRFVLRLMRRLLLRHRYGAQGSRNSEILDIIVPNTANRAHFFSSLIIPGESFP